MRRITRRLSCQKRKSNSEEREKTKFYLSLCHSFLRERTRNFPIARGKESWREIVVKHPKSLNENHCHRFSVPRALCLCAIVHVTKTLQ